MAEKSPNTSFKEPIPRKRSAFKPVQSPLNQTQSSMRLLQRMNMVQRQKLKLVKLLYKFVQSPASLTKGERITLMAHPIIRDLINYSKSNNCGPGNFYIPLNSLLESIFQDGNSGNLHSNSDDYVEVLFEQLSTNKNEVSTNTCTDGSQISQNTSEAVCKGEGSFLSASNTQKIGFYTPEVRQEKIKKYKQKIVKWLNKKTHRKTRDSQKEKVIDNSQKINH